MYTSLVFIELLFFKGFLLMIVGLVGAGIFTTVRDCGQYLVLQDKTGFAAYILIIAIAVIAEIQIVRATLIVLRT